jgi:hypothetical protein
MRRYLAFILITIMAVSALSTAGVVTTQKAAAQLTTTPITVSYQEGAVYTFAPRQYNIHVAFFVPFVTSKGTPLHTEAATRGSMYTSIRTTATQCGTSAARVGTYWKLTGDWDTIKQKRCKVTVKCYAVLYAKGGSDTVARVVDPLHGVFHEEVYGNDPVHLKVVKIIESRESTVENFFGQNGDGTITGFAGADASASVYPGPQAGQASASVVCTSIVLEFPQPSR